MQKYKTTAYFEIEG